jgi:hypothetical protein
MGLEAEGVNWVMKYFLLTLGLLSGGGLGADAAGEDTALLRQLVTTYFDGVASKDFVKLRSVTTKDFVIYEDGKVCGDLHLN